MLVDRRPLSWSGTADLRNTPPRGAIRAARGGASLTVAPGRAVDGARLAVLIADPPNPLPVVHRVVDISAHTNARYRLQLEDAHDIDHLRSDPASR